MNTYLNLYNETSQAICDNSAPVLNQFRKAACDALSQNGFPDRKVEEYLNSRFAVDGNGKNDILDHEYGININRLKFPIKPEKVFRCAVPGIQAQVMFVVNDILYSEPKNDVNGVVFCSLNTACQSHSEIVAKHIGTTVNNNDAYSALNNMFAQDGYFLYVPKNTKVEIPIQIINVMRANMDSMANAHNLIVLEENAEVHVLICDHAIDKHKFFANRQTEIIIGDGAKLHYYNVESSHEMMNNVSTTNVEQGRNSHFVYSTLGLMNGNTRNNVCVNLNGEGADVTLGGMLISDKHQHTDNHTVINHNAANCNSTELYKYILDEEAHAIFSGLVLVKEGAQQTTAQQTNRNILLTETAQVHTNPQLIIYADDVKCGHGATTGQLDEKAMFYMQQRGIGKKEARMLLLSAFAADVIDLVEIEPLRDRLTAMIERRLRGGNSKCETCGAIC